MQPQQNTFNFDGLASWAQRNQKLIVVLILGFFVAYYGLKVMRTWPKAKGFEYEWIAISLASGEGFSFDGQHRWLFHIPDDDPTLEYRFEAADPALYYPTAWMDPVYTHFMALNFYLFGEHARAVLVVFNILFLVLTAWVLFLIGKRVWGPPAGYLAAALLLSIPYFKLGMFRAYIGNVWAAGLMVSLCCLALVWCMEKPSLKRGLGLGTLVGLTALTHAGTLLFTGFASLAVLSAPERISLRVKTIAAIVLGAAVVISPWTIRNYVVFEQFIPVRTGAGLSLYMGNAVLGHAMDPSRPAAPPGHKELWRASDANETVRLSAQTKEHHIAHTWAKQTVEADAPPEFANYGEHQRDRVYKAHAWDFIFSNPGVTARLSIAKIRFYLFNWSWLHSVVSILAIIGALLFFRDTRSRAVIFVLAGLCAPYVLTQPIFYRYRYVADPLFFLLASATVYWIVMRIGSYLRERKSATG